MNELVHDVLSALWFNLNLSWPEWKHNLKCPLSVLYTGCVNQ